LSSIEFSSNISSTPRAKMRTPSSSENIAQTACSKSKWKREKGKESLDQSMKIVEDVAKPFDREKSKMKGKKSVFTPPVSEMVKPRRPMTRSTAKELDPMEEGVAKAPAHHVAKRSIEDQPQSEESDLRVKRLMNQLKEAQTIIVKLREENR